MGRDWTVEGSSPAADQIFRTRPDRPLGPSSLLYIGYRVCFPGVKRSGSGADNPPPLVPIVSTGKAVPLPPLCASLASNKTAFNVRTLSS